MVHRTHQLVQKRCQIDIVAALAWQDPSNERKVVRPASPERNGDRSPGKGGVKPTGEAKNILEIAEEFKEIVTQMAFEKFDFHQWFRFEDKSAISRSHLCASPSPRKSH